MAYEIPLIITTGVGTPPPNNAQRYTPIVGCSSISNWQSSTSRGDCHFTMSGTLSNLWVRTTVALTGTQSWVFDLFKNGAAVGTMSCTFNSSSGLVVSSAGPSSITSGDRLSLRSTPTNTPNAQTGLQFGFMFTSGGTSMPMFAAWNAGTTGSGYACPGSTSSSNQAQSSRGAILPCGGSVSAMYMRTAQPAGTGVTRTVTLMKNGVDTAITLSINGNSLLTATNTFTPVHFSEGDTIEFRQDISGTAVSAVVTVGIDFTPDNAGDVPLFSPGNGSVDGTSTHYASIQGNSDNTEVTESNVFGIAPSSFWLTKWRADIATSPGTGASRLFTVRKNSIDTSAAITLSNSATTGNYTGTPISFAAGDLLSWSEVPTNTPSSTNPLGTSALITRVDPTAVPGNFCLNWF